MRNTTFCICENKDADQLRGNRKADQRLCFCYIDKSLYFLNPKFQASSNRLKLYSPVCVGPGRKAEGWFSHDAARIYGLDYLTRSLQALYYNPSLQRGGWLSKI